MTESHLTELCGAKNTTFYTYPYRTMLNGIQLFFKYTWQRHGYAFAEQYYPSRHD